MKIRMIRNHAAVEEVQSEFDRVPLELVGTYPAFYRRKGPRDGQWEVFTKDEWEIVPKEMWVDVTESCDIKALGDIFCGGQCIQGLAELCSNGYRIRKVRVSPIQHLNEPFKHASDALIIEKKMP